MSGHSSVGVISTVTGTVSPDPFPLDVLKTEEDSLQLSVTIDDTSLKNRKSTVSFSKEKPTIEPTPQQCSCCCKILQETAVPETKKQEVDAEKLLAERENQLREEFSHQMEKEIILLKERFDFILQNEQVRSSYMLREAYRERQEKISALQTQLECKNLAGLIYVLCSERRKAKLEKLQIIEDYTTYINYLRDILTDGQELILNLSRGYKTAARVDYEWKEKMKKVINEFQNFVYHFAGGSPESNQYFFDLPNLLKINTPTTDNLEEDPCDEPDELPSLEGEEEKPWYERLDGNDRPFIMYGDMSEFTPDVRRETLKTVRANKTAPRRWKEYVFNSMMLRSACVNADVIKDEYWKHLPTKEKWECHAMHEKESRDFTAEQMSHRPTAQSIDVRGNMGSILKIITSSGLGQQATKSNLLGARDSMEIASTTKLREKHKHSDHSKVVIKVKNRRTSFFDEPRDPEELEEDDFPEIPVNEAKEATSKVEDDESVNMSSLGGHHTDSLEILTNHVPDQDHKINYEKVCPTKECNRRKLDSFVRSLPAYMKSNPFTHFEQSFDQYEVCSPEQLEILTKRIEEKKKRERGEEKPAVDPLAEWTPSVEGVAVQTSEVSYLSLPPCTCRAPDVTPVDSTGKVFKLVDLIPVKQNVEQIAKECLFDDLIKFDRFKLLGLDRSSHDLTDPNLEFSKARLQQIKKIIKQHPSLSELFQANCQP